LISLWPRQGVGEIGGIWERGEGLTKVFGKEIKEEGKTQIEYPFPPSTLNGPGYGKR